MEEEWDYLQLHKLDNIFELDPLSYVGKAEDILERETHTIFEEVEEIENKVQCLDEDSLDSFTVC